MTAVEDSAPAPASPAVEAAPAAAPKARRCENCGSPLYGDHCYACGQPTKGLVRHFSSILGDFFDTVFNIDSRVLRTLGPLAYSPGFLSLEYFAGRRVRYVTPMRLFLFLSLIAFFAVQLSVDFDSDGGDGKRGDGGIHVGTSQGDSFSRAKTVAEVERARDAALVELEKAREEMKDVPAGTVPMDIGISQVKKKAAQRIAEIQAAEKAGKPVGPGKVVEDDDDVDFQFNGKKWDPETNPIAFGWLPDFVNRSLNKRAARAKDVLKSDGGQRSVFKAMFNVLPQTLLVLMPIFALMLKISYLFKRRLYMEHLIVALHSHAFIALAVTACLGVGALRGMVTDGGFVQGLLGWILGLMIAWIPLYLLIMQKRVYAQGWAMTIAKYSVLGLCYSVLLSFAMAASVIAGLLTL